MAVASISMIRTKFFDKRPRRKKAEQCLKTKYYYRHGRLTITPVDNSSLGMYLGVYVMIKKFSRERDQFLVEYADGELTWTDQVVPVRPAIDGHELYYTCFELLAERNYRHGQLICYRTQRNYAFLRKEIQTCCPEYSMFIKGQLNLDHVPKSFNFALGYADNEAMPLITPTEFKNKFV
jgi:hypothetical protein